MDKGILDGLTTIICRIIEVFLFAAFARAFYIGWNEGGIFWPLCLLGLTIWQAGKLFRKQEN